MKVKILDENTYGVFDDAGVEVGKGAITDEWKAAKKNKRGLETLIAKSLGADVAPEVVMVDVAGPVEIPKHDHDPDDTKADIDHVHNYADIDHGHPEFGDLKAGIEQESRFRLQADTNLDSNLKQFQEEVALTVRDLRKELANAINDLDASQSNSVSNLRRVIATVQESIPAVVVGADDLKVLAEAISILRSEMTSLRHAVDNEQSRRAEMADSVRSFIQSEIAAARVPEGTYATREELSNITLRSGKFRLRVLSKQNIDGNDLLTVEEIQ